MTSLHKPKVYRSRSFFPGAGVFFAGAGAGGGKTGVCTALKYMFNVGGFKKNILSELISGLTITVFKIMSTVLFRGNLVKIDLTSKETNLYPSSKSLHRNSYGAPFVK